MWPYQEHRGKLDLQTAAVAGTTSTADLHMFLQLSSWALPLQHWQRRSFPALSLSRLGCIVIQFCDTVPV